jgi:biopolymer transport protein ExbD
MRFSKPKREEISLGVSIAPLIDIVFLLLIFFILTSHIEIIPGLDITLPGIAERGSDKSYDNLVVALDRQGNCFLDKEKIDLRDLYHRFQESAGTAQINLILQADRDVRHGDVVQVMDLAKKAGITSIVIAAQWESERIF